MNYLVLPSGSEVKEPACNVGDTGDVNSVPGSGRYLGGGNGYKPQYSCLKNSMDRGTGWAAVPGVAKCQTQLSRHTRIFTMDSPFHKLELTQHYKSSILQKFFF